MGAAVLLSLAACKKDKVIEMPAPLVYANVSTLAGSGTEGFADGAGAVAQFSHPEGVAADGAGNVFVADPGNARIRKITAAGLVTTLAGTGASATLNGPLATAQFEGPTDVALDYQGNLYVTDNYCVRKITATTVSTFAGTGTLGYVDGPATTAKFGSLQGIAVSPQGVLYVSDYENACIRKIMPDGTVSTLAGSGQRGFADGPSRTARFNSPEGMVLDGEGNLFVADFGGQRIRKIAPDGSVSTFAGTGQRGHADGAGSSAQFSGPTGLAIGDRGNLYVADLGNNCIRKITPAGEVSTIVGSRVQGFADGPVGTAQFDGPLSLTLGLNETLIVGELGQRIRKVTPK